jgi:hypothetical protein
MRDAAERVLLEAIDPPNPAVIDWAALGFTESEAAELSAIQRTPLSFPLPEVLRLWRQWGREIGMQANWIYEELEAGYHYRDDLDETLSLVPDPLLPRLLDFIDLIDRRYRDETVYVGVDGDPPPAAWWWGRIPIANAPRRYLFDDPHDPRLRTRPRYRP